MDGWGCGNLTSIVGQSGKGIKVALFETEQQETVRELAEVLRLAQAMGRRLESETHGARYAEVRSLLELLHQARVQADSLEQRFIVGPGSDEPA